MKKLFVIMVLCAFLMAGTNQNVFANSSELENDIPRIEEQLRKYGVKESDIIKLIEKLRHGEVWDSMKPEYQNLQPQIVLENYEKTVYPDGSIAVQTYEPINNMDSTDGISVYSIVNKRGVKVLKSTVLVTLVFKVDYSRNTSTGKAKITSQYGKSYAVLGGTATEDAYGFKKGWLNPTAAWYAVNVTTVGNISSARYWLRIHVNGNGKWQESDF